MVNIKYHHFGNSLLRLGDDTSKWQNCPGPPALAAAGRSMTGPPPATLAAGQVQRRLYCVPHIRKAKTTLRHRQILLHIQQNHQLKKQLRSSQQLLTVLQTQHSSRLLYFRLLLFVRLMQPDFTHHSGYMDVLTYPAVSLILFWSEFPLRRPAPSSYIHQSPKNQHQKQLVS